MCLHPDCRNRARITNDYSCLMKTSLPIVYDPVMKLARRCESCRSRFWCSTQRFFKFTHTGIIQVCYNCNSRVNNENRA